MTSSIGGLCSVRCSFTSRVKPGGSFVILRARMLVSLEIQRVYPRTAYHSMQLSTRKVTTNLSTDRREVVVITRKCRTVNGHGRSNRWFIQRCEYSELSSPVHAVRTFWPCAMRGSVRCNTYRAASVNGFGGTTFRIERVTELEVRNAALKNVISLIRSSATHTQDRFARPGSLVRLLPSCRWPMY